MTEDSLELNDAGGWIVTCARCGKTSTAPALIVGSATDTDTGETTEHPVCPSCRRILLGLIITEKAT